VVEVTLQKIRALAHDELAQRSARSDLQLTDGQRWHVPHGHRGHVAVARQEFETLSEAAKRVLIHELGVDSAPLVAADPLAWETTESPVTVDDKETSAVIQRHTHFLFSATKHELGEQLLAQDRLPKEVGLGWE